MRKNSYRSTALAKVNVSEVATRCGVGRVCVGLDIAKSEVLAVVRDAAGRFERPWKIKQPAEVGLFIETLRRLREDREVLVALESTGTYGDSLRQALTDAGFEPRRLSGKAVRDYREIFDGVPSAHDGKDAAMIAELAAHGKSRPWPLRTDGEWEGEIRRQVKWLEMQQPLLQAWQGRLEALLARHWPELPRLLKLKSVTLLRILRHYGSPAAVAADAGAAERITRWGGRYLVAEKVRRIVDSAANSVGVRLSAAELGLVREVAKQALLARRVVRETQRDLVRLADKHRIVTRMASVVGKATACVLFVTVGDPRNFPCGAAYRKAMGLNLKERSSGKFQGQLRITKRGSSAARRWLYFAALRLIMRSSVRSWFEAKKRKDSGRGQAAVVGVMRKMALAVHVVATRNETFYASRLFPGRPLPSRAAREAAPVAEVADAGAWDLTREGKDQNTSPGTGAAGSST